VALADRHAARTRALVQDHIPEQVLAAGSVSAAGTGTASRFGPPNGRLGSAIGRRAGRHAPDGAPQTGFPPRTWLAVTATRVYAFAAEGDDVGALIGVWDRTATTVTTSAKLAATRLFLRFGGAAEVGLEARRWGAGNHQLLRYLLDPTRL
jgi:hypothetical protein